MLCNIFISGAASTGKTTLLRALQTHFEAQAAAISPDPPPPPAIITEVARDVMNAHPITVSQIRGSPSVSLQLQKRILEAQLRAQCFVLGADLPESAAAYMEPLSELMPERYHGKSTAAAHHWFISDRSCVDPVIYTKLFVARPHGDSTTSIPTAMEDLLKTPTYHALEEDVRKGLLILIEPNDATLRDDGVRMMPLSTGEWHEFHKECCEFLEERKVRFRVIGTEVIDVGDRVEFVLSEWRTMCGSVPSGEAPP